MVMNPYAQLISKLPWYKTVGVIAVGMVPAALAFYTYGKQAKKDFAAAAKSSAVLGLSVIASTYLIDEMIKDDLMDSTTNGSTAGLGASLFQAPNAALGWEPNKLGLITATRSQMSGVYGCNGCY